VAAKTIGDWHEQLHDHFAALRHSRDASSPGSPVFALEHGLDLEQELPELNAVVRDVVAGTRLPSQSWLPLVVYAAEIGYRYEGDEYWPVFEAETPGWKRRGSSGREYVRRKYELFAETYGGAQPSGAWAAWFKNIAWPITHAVLPADLQRHLARLLSDYRYAFTTELLEDHEALGERLAARSGDTSTRFRKFAENTSLLGLVAASLLLGDEDEVPLLSGDVLHRIVVDLSHERQAGAWLRDAKRAAVGVRRKGLLGKAASVSNTRGTQTSDQRWPRLELTLSCRRLEPGWAVYVAVPSFESITHRFPSIRDQVDRVRYRIDGVAGVRARGSMMYPQGPLELKAMPAPNETPVRVEGGTSALSESLVDHCRMPVPPWLFRIREPGLAHEVRTNRVRPGEQYILLACELPRASDLPGARMISVTTEGVDGMLFSVPTEVGDAQIDTLRQMGLGLVSDLVVWPAGLVPASWDGDGRAAWPAGEDPIIGIRSARRVARCIVSTAEDVAEVSWPAEGDTVYFQITGLEIGTHSVDVVLLDSNEPAAMVAQGQVVVRILEPVDSTASASSGQGIQTWAYPSRPTLDELWRGNAALAVDGPHGEKVQFELRLMTRNGRRTLARKSFSSVLPVREDRWHELLRGAEGDPELEAQVGQAEELVVVVSNPVLGFAEIRAERPFEPLRWITGYDRSGPFARLIDHLDSDDLQVWCTDVGSPAESVLVVLPENRELRSEDGRLVVASAEGFQAAVVLPPHVSGGLESLRKLAVRPSLQTGSRSATSVRRMIELAHLWTRAASPADQYAARLQSQVNDAVVARLSGMIAGTRWWDLEREALNNGRFSPERLLSAVGDSGAERATAAEITKLAPFASAGPAEHAATFAQVLEAHGWHIEADLAELILRLGTVPGSVALTDPRTPAAIDAALERPALVRLARLFALVLGNANRASGTSLLEEWTWG
jgi:hypothetical protein